MNKNSHSECDHPRTKAARAACRRARVAAKPQISPFALAEAYASNDMWTTLNSKQEWMIVKYRVVYATCEYCEQDHPCFVFDHLGLNVCGPCERMHNVHEYEEDFS